MQTRSQLPSRGWFPIYTLEIGKAKDKIKIDKGA